MARPTRPTTGLRGHAHLVRVVVAAVLAGYGLGLSATSTGHGFGPDEHQIAEHQEAIEAIEAISLGMDGGAHQYDDADREEPPAPAPVTITLDKHVLVSASAVPMPPGARALDDVSPAGPRASVVLPVEVRPPEQAV